jgi:hypothetical protein
MELGSAKNPPINAPNVSMVRTLAACIASTESAS